MMMQTPTPLPVQIELWIKTLKNKSTPTNVKEVTELHLRNIRAIIDEVLTDSAKAKRRYDRQ
jgi:hypothetical protein